MRLVYLIFPAILIPSLTLACKSKPDNGDEKRHLDLQINAMQSELGTTFEVSKEISKLTKDIHSKSTDQLGKLLILQDKFKELADIPADNFKAKFQLLQDTMSRFHATTNQQLDEYYRMLNINGQSIDDLFATNKAAFQQINSTLRDFSKQVSDHKTSLTANLNQVAGNYTQLNKRLRYNLKVPLQKINEQVQAISVEQLAEIDRLQRVSTLRLGKLKNLADGINRYVNEVQLQAADYLLKNASQLGDLMRQSLTHISRRLDPVADGQHGIEIAIKYSKALHRIGYLQDWWLKINNKKSEVNQDLKKKEHEKWAKAVLYGHPSDRPIEEVLATLEALVVGNGATGEVTLIDKYFGNIQSHVQQRKMALIRSISEWERFMAENNAETDFHQSEQYLLEVFADQLRSLEVAAFAMAIKARVYLDELKSKRNVGEINARKKRDTRSSHRPSANRIRFRSVSAILVAANQTAKVQDQAFDEALGKSAPTVRTELPLVILGDDVFDSRSAPLVQRKKNEMIFANSRSALRQICIDSSKSNKNAISNGRMMLTGCRLCSSAKCPISSNNVVSMQCSFKNFGQSQSSSVIYPADTKEASAAESCAERQQGANSASNKGISVVIGANRVNDTDLQVVCGLVVKKLPDFDGAFGLVINVCSRLNGSFLYTKTPTPSGNFQIKIINQFSLLWVRQTGGTTTGVGFYVSNNPFSTDNSSDAVLNIEVESVYS